METAHGTAPGPKGGHFTVPRAWEIALDPSGASFAESEHLLRCEACNTRVRRAMTALARRHEPRQRYAAALVLLAALVRTRARQPFALPRPATVGFDTAPARDDGFVTYEFDDPDLHAAVSREPDGRYLLHVER